MYINGEIDYDRLYLQLSFCASVTVMYHKDRIELSSKFGPVIKQDNTIYILSVAQFL